jgi:hypothetical protein
MCDSRVAWAEKAPGARRAAALIPAEAALLVEAAVLANAAALPNFGLAGTLDGAAPQIGTIRTGGPA